MKKVIIDNRMRSEEKNKLESLGYKIIELNSSESVYQEVLKRFKTQKGE